MGFQSVTREASAEQLRKFVSALLKDVRALEYMLNHGMIESDIRRIGAEQEMFIIDRHCRPAAKAMEILAAIDDHHFTTELASFNLEFNLDPVICQSTCLTQLEQHLTALLTKARTAAQQHNSDVLLIGILPTLRKSDLALTNMTPKPRYAALNDAMTRLRHGEYELFIRGTDELYLRHDSVMLEAVNTSFQVHFQVAPEEFAHFYNIAQAIAGPVMAIATNSPLLFGKKLWRETRIAVFQHAVDTRQPAQMLRDSMPRVAFGNSWVRESVLEIFQEDIARFRVLMAVEVEEDPLEMLALGQVPKLRALQVHNSTVYRWNRPCYGVTDGKPHLRIENRLFPAGPSIVDEVANAAFWLGLINGMALQYDDITQVMDFDDAKSNLIAAARQGVKAQFAWLHSRTLPAQDLIIKELLPLARAGLACCNVNSPDIDRYLGVIEQRVRTGQTGAEWLLNSCAAMKYQGTASECVSAVTAAVLKHQQEGQPVSEWPLAEMASSRRDWWENCRVVEQYMTTDVFTVKSDDNVELVLSVMNWRRIKHLPVEDEDNNLVGIVNHRSLLQLCQNGSSQSAASLPVSAIMQTNVQMVTPETPTLEAIALMRRTGATCLPVVRNSRLVGIVTQNDFMHIAAQFLAGSMGEVAG